MAGVFGDAQALTDILEWSNIFFSVSLAKETPIRDPDKTYIVLRS